MTDKLPLKVHDENGLIAAFANAYEAAHLMHGWPNAFTLRYKRKVIWRVPADGSDRGRGNMDEEFLVISAREINEAVVARNLEIIRGKYGLDGVKRYQALMNEAGGAS